LGYGISENRAIHVSLSNDSIKTVGTQALMLVDLSDATRTGFERRNIRISYLGDGDQVNGRTGRIKLAKGKVEYETSGAIPVVSVPEDIWARGSLNTFLQDFALSGRESVQVKDRFFTIIFTRDSKTRLVTPKDSFQREEVGFVKLRVDLIPLPTLETELEALKADIATAEESEAPAY
ncbi:MAG: hypothetical protein SFY68_10420, partial [Candidatus Sumerlaeia bacterium]|nr:hypothetical protein [Candidatus Sumerlaeia bacterium]